MVLWARLSALTVSLALVAGCTFLPLPTPGARERTSILPGSVAAQRYTVQIQVTIGSSFTLKSEGYKATDVDKVAFYLIEEAAATQDPQLPGFYAVYEGESSWSPGRVAQAEIEGWLGRANTVSIFNLPPGDYLVVGQALKAGQNITKDGYGATRPDGQAARVTVLPDGSVSPERVALQLALRDGLVSEFQTGIHFVAGQDLPIQDRDNYDW